jgi:hypothetical protein
VEGEEKEGGDEERGRGGGKRRRREVMRGEEGGERVVFVGTYQNASQSPSVEAFVDYLPMKEEVWRGRDRR